MATTSDKQTDETLKKLEAIPKIFSASQDSIEKTEKEMSKLESLHAKMLSHLSTGADKTADSAKKLSASTSQSLKSTAKSAQDSKSAADKEAKDKKSDSKDKGGIASKIASAAGSGILDVGKLAVKNADGYAELVKMQEELKTSTNELLKPIGDMLIPVLEEMIQTLIPALRQMLPDIIDQVTQFLPPIIDLVSQLLPQFVAICDALLPTLVQLISDIMPVLVQVFTDLLPPLVELVGVLLPPLVKVLDILLEPLLKLVEAILPVLVQLFEAVNPLIEALLPIIELLAESFAEQLVEAIDLVMPIIQALMDYLSGLIEFITGVFSGDWSKAWNGIVEMFRGAFNYIPTIIETIINGAIDLINDLIDGINDITGEIGISAIPTIEHVALPRLKTGIDFVPNDFFPAFLDAGEAVLTRQEATAYRALGGIGNIERLLSFSFMALNSGASAASAGAPSFTQIINSPKALNRYDLYRQTRNILGASTMGVR